MIDDRIPPHDISAEEAVLACLMIDGDKIQEIPLLEPNDFYHEPLKEIFAICLDLYHHGAGCPHGKLIISAQATIPTRN